MIADPAQLPETLPIFPLGNVLLLPGGLLPLHIFEPRYVAMVEDAINGEHLIGMVQPSGAIMPCGTPAVHRVGCAGQITACTEAEGRYHISLTGRVRFQVAAELGALRGYRLVRPDWSSYHDDLHSFAPYNFERWRLLASLRKYFRQHNLSCDWAAAEACPASQLITILCMICPFTGDEKQALLEAENLTARASLLQSLLELNAVTPSATTMQ